MSEPARPRIVVSLPARSFEEAIAQRDEARAAGADAAEIRIDRWAPADRARLAELFPSPIPLVATLRSTRQGGEGPDDPAARAPELERYAALPFGWIDLELGRDDALWDRLPPEDRIGRIVSCHLAESEYGDWTRRLLELEGAPGIGKLVVAASVARALGEILPRLLVPRDDPVVVHTTGPSGPLLRALARRLGAPLVYAALPFARGRPPVEASQIPVDRLRPYLDAEGTPPLFGVAGRPIAHSESPAVHAAWIREERRTGLYVALEFADDAEFVASVPMLAANGFRGLNVTHPFKGPALAVATEAEPSALACGVANCLTFRDGGIAAANTDLAAILRRLEELRAGGAWDGRSLAVVGAGGAARATLAAARELRVPTTVHARRPEAAEGLAELFRARAGSGVDAVPGSLVVHATSTGRAGEGPLDPALRPVISRASRVLDWVYRPVERSVEELARSAGAPYEDGWRLFVYQAAESYALWWGEAPRTALVDRTIGEAGCAA